MLQGFCEERNQGLLRGSLSDSLPYWVCSFCICSTDSCHRQKVDSRSVCVCQDSLLWLQAWLLPHPQRINVSFGYIQPSFGGPWAQGMFVRYTCHVLLTVSAGTQTRVYAMHGVRCYLCTARGSGSQGSRSPRFPEKLLRVQGFWKAACFEGFPVLEGADSSWSGCCLPNTFCS